VVADHFRRQYGLITRAQAFAAGLSRRQIDGCLKRREWIIAAPRVYRIASAPVTFEQRALAACLSWEAVTSHTTAGVLQGLDGVRVGRVHITVAHGRRVAARGVVVHYARHLDRRDRTLVRGIPATGLARTLVDVASRITEAELIEGVDGAVVGRDVSPDEVRAALARAGARRAGGSAMQRVLEAWTPGPIPESVAEMVLIRRILGRGLPAPERQFEVYDSDRFLGTAPLLVLLPDGTHEIRAVAPSGVMCTKLGLVGDRSVGALRFE